MTVILDAGALIAYERGDHLVQAHLELAERTRTAATTTTGAVAQVWRNPAKQVALGRALRGLGEVELNRQRARSIGVLLRESRTADVVDASIVDIANDGDEILTSDPEDIAHLAAAAGKTLFVTKVG